MNANFFVKSHGLGNEYVVLDSENINFALTPELIKTICNVHFGIGSDGILLKVPSTTSDFGLRIFNPDASEAEKSGNGIRIFSKYLFDYGFATSDSYSIETLGGKVQAHVVEKNNNKAFMIKVDMGKSNFNSEDIPVAINKPECIDEKLVADDKEYVFSCVSVGNPHCVIVKDTLDKDEIMHYGTFIENHELFPNRINLQFVKVLSPDEIELLIWERGAGYTLASGSSSCGASSVVMKKGLTNRKLTVQMQGGSLNVEIDEAWNIQMTGEVREVASGYLSDELIENN